MGPYGTLREPMGPFGPPFSATVFFEIPGHAHIPNLERLRAVDSLCWTLVTDDWSAQTKMNGGNRCKFCVTQQVLAAGSKLALNLF